MSEQTEVAIQLTSRIAREEEPSEVTTSRFEGRLMEKGQDMYLSYVETVPEIGESTHIIKMTPDHVLLMRKGATSMRLPLINGEVTTGEYQSPIGPFAMQAIMESHQFNWGGNTGMLRIVYVLHLQNQYAGKFTLEFKLKAR